MECPNVEICLEHIKAWFNAKGIGQMMIVNAESDADYRDILGRLEADVGKEKHYISSFCPKGLPNLLSAARALTAPGDHVFIGLSLIGLFDETRLKNEIHDLLDKQNARGKSVILTEHCEKYLEEFINRDIRLKNRVVLVKGSPSPRPKIQLLKSEGDVIGIKPLPSLQALLKVLEIGNPEGQKVFSVVSRYGLGAFSNSAYPVREAPDIFEQLCIIYPDISRLKSEYGDKEQWRELAKNIKQYGSLASFFKAEFNDPSSLVTRFYDSSERSSEDKWLLWLAMKYYGVKSSDYLSNAVKESSSYDNLLEHIYLDLSKVDCSQSNFSRLYQERKAIIRHLVRADRPENLNLSSKYCDSLNKLQEKAIYYLTDLSDVEKMRFMDCITNSDYHYSQPEVESAVSSMSKDLESYMKDFSFDAANTKLSESDAYLYGELTDYFKRYKWQKLTKLSDIDKDFLDLVEKYARSHPYNKLPSREQIIRDQVKSMDKDTVQPYFFDALGVEYLSFILAKCKELGLACKVSIGRCELPSTTEQNKPLILADFNQFKKDCRKIGELDEIKHQSEIIQYEKCKCPVHLFSELSVIDEELKKIKATLSEGDVISAVIASDHGASRLAVLPGKKCRKIGLKEKGEKSGRCCKVDEDPGIDCAAYENGYAVLANYDRFKGSHAAEVEVHGGASLEEVLVPVIILSKFREDKHIAFIESKIKLERRKPLKLVLTFNVPIKAPRLRIKGNFYTGQLNADMRTAEFDVSDIKRKGTYSADVYDGDTSLSVILNFDVEKPLNAKENNLGI